MKNSFTIFLVSLFSLLFLLCVISPGYLPAQWVQTSGPSAGYSYAFIANGSTYFSGTQRGVFRSTDSGLSWYQPQTELNTYLISSFAMDGSTILAGAEPGGLYYSTDNGVTWMQSSLNNVSVTAIASTSSSILAGTLGSGILRSTDHGATWTQTPLSSEDVSCMIISGSYIFAGASADTIGIYRSSDDGVSWTRCYYADGWPTMALARNSTSIFAATLSTYYMGRVLRSTDNGANWVITSLSGHKIYSLVTNGTDIYAGLYGEGVYRSTDNGNNWSATNFGQITAASMNYLGTKIFAGTYYFGIYYTTNNGTNWIQPSYPGGNVVSLGCGGNKIYAGDNEMFSSVGLFSSSNSGTNWSAPMLSARQIDGIAYSGSNTCLPPQTTEFICLPTTAQTGRSFTAAAAEPVQ
ncbi:MAG: hypothetical protein LWX07_00625 [Bacteroidetes bacterium]|nr:hypothetical protein [Bacteroidota bacterium]